MKISIKKTFFLSILAFVTVLIQAGMVPEEVKTRLMGKYQGKINGIEKLARSLGDSVTASQVSAIRQKIDQAVNQVRGMGSVDLPATEASIEKTIHGLLTDIFKQTISIAEKTAYNETATNLFAVAPWNKKIIWNAAQTHILMLTWIPAAYRASYDAALGKDLSITWDAWVTAVPQVKEFAKNYQATNKEGFNLTDRIEQYLGLIPSKPPYATSQNKLFVEMWVRPEDLERPCLDAEVIDSSCIYDPAGPSAAKLPPAFRDMSKFVPMTNEHKAWYAKEKQGKYSGQWAMPWTRFGYTYDWGSLRQSTGKLAAQGASEYLIKKGSVVKIHAIIPTDDYPNAAIPKSGYTYSE